MIEVDGLTHRFGSLTAIDDIHFEIGEGQVFGFIGPNGAGKTTTIRILATLLEPTAGQARIAGHCVSREPETVRRLIGYMPDLFGLYDGVRVWEYLDFFAAAYGIPRGVRRTVIGDCLTLTDLDAARERMVSELSKGMRQRLCLAKTLVHDPQVLILDEPASGLDPRARIEIRALIKELATMGKTILLSSHILSELDDLCTEIGVIEQGRVIASGPIDQILLQLKGQRGRPMRLAFCRDAARAEALLEQHPLVSALCRIEQQLELDFLGTDEALVELIALLVAQRLPLIECTRPERDLEGLFMRITEGHIR